MASDQEFSVFQTCHSCQYLFEIFRCLVCYWWNLKPFREYLQLLFPSTHESASNSYASIARDHLLFFLDFTSTLREKISIWRLLINSYFSFLFLSSSSNLDVEKCTKEVKSLSCLSTLIYISLLLIAKMQRSFIFSSKFFEQLNKTFRESADSTPSSKTSASLV